MCSGIALAVSETPTEWAEWSHLKRRLHHRGGEPEYWFLYRDPSPKLPIWRDGQLLLARWGNSQGQSAVLPRTGWTWLSSIERGSWANIESTIIDIPASLGCENGVWFRIRQGVRGLLVADEQGLAVVYMICEPSSHYYRMMTRGDRMPVFINEKI